MLIYKFPYANIKTVSMLILYKIYPKFQPTARYSVHKIYCRTIHRNTLTHHSHLPTNVESSACMHYTCYVLLQPKETKSIENAVRIKPYNDKTRKRQADHRGERVLCALLTPHPSFFFVGVVARHIFPCFAWLRLTTFDAVFYFGLNCMCVCYSPVLAWCLVQYMVNFVEYICIKCPRTGPKLCEYVYSTYYTHRHIHMISGHDSTSHFDMVMLCELKEFCVLGSDKICGSMLVC